MVIPVQRLLELQTRAEKNSSRNIVVKTLSIQGKERLLKSAREKHQLTHIDDLIKITVGFSAETLNERKA
jgi:hypothetical protein